jgi:hypothetical protein
MTNNPAIISSIKFIIAFFAATMMCAVIYAIPASAAPWGDYIAGGDYIVMGGDTLTVDDYSKGKVIVQSGTLTVNGDSGMSTYDLVVELQGTSSLIWNANNGGAVIVTGTGKSITVSGNLITSSWDNSALTIDANVEKITITNASIQHLEGLQNCINIDGGSADITIDGVDVGVYEPLSDKDGVVVSSAGSLLIKNTEVRYIENNTGHALNLTGITNGTTITNSTIRNISSSKPAIITDSSLSIGGSATVIESNYYGINISGTGTTLEMTGGSVTGISGIYTPVGSFNTLNLKGGTITAEKDAALLINGTTDVVINGAELVGDNYGVQLTGTSSTLKMINGSVSAKTAITATGAGKVEILGGRVTGISYGYGIVTGTTPVTISGGEILGEYAGLSISSGTVDITGGTISSSNNNGISLSGGTLNITPGRSSRIIIKGATRSIFEYGASPNYNNIQYYYISENYGGTAKTGYNNNVDPFANSTAYKYIEFLGSLPSFTVTVNGGTANGQASPLTVPADSTVSIAPVSRYFKNWTAVGVALIDPETGVQTFTMPFNDVIITAVSYNSTGGSNGPASSTTPPPPIDYTTLTAKEEYITVTATLNKSGSVNSTKTAADVKIASGRTDKINLIIPEGGTGISDAAMKKIIAAANGAKIYLYFEFYNSATAAAEDLGSVYVPISGATGQVLTSIYYDTKNIDYAESYIKRRWGKTILDSFETADKSGWVNTATVTVSLESLDFAADDGEKLYAAIYDTKTKKWYRANIEIIDGEAVIKTRRTGVYTILTEPIY